MSLHDDLIDSSTNLFQKLSEMDARASKIEAKANRIREMNRILVYRIQNSKIQDEAFVDEAIALLYETALSVDDILKKCDAKYNGYVNKEKDLARHNLTITCISSPNSQGAISEIWIDGLKFAGLANGETAELYVVPGKHVLTIKTSGCLDYTERHTFKKDIHIKIEFIANAISPSKDCPVHKIVSLVYSFHKGENA